MNDMDFGKEFISRVVPKLNAEEKIGLFDYTSQVQQQALEKQKQSSQSLKAQRKQGIVDTIYNGGQPQMAQMQPLTPPMEK